MAVGNDAVHECRGEALRLAVMGEGGGAQSLGIAASAGAGPTDRVARSGAGAEQGTAAVFQPLALTRLLSRNIQQAAVQQCGGQRGLRDPRHDFSLIWGPSPMLCPRQTGCTCSRLFSTRLGQISKRVLYILAANPRMMEKPGFIGAIWHFCRSSSWRVPAVHLDECSFA